MTYDRWEICCIACKLVFKVEDWDVIPCPRCGAEYDYDDDGYIEWEAPHGRIGEA